MLQERSVTDENGTIWRVQQSFVSAGAVGLRGKFPEATPWLTLTSEDGERQYTGASASGLDDMSDEELLRHLEQFQQEKEE